MSSKTSIRRVGLTDIARGLAQAVPDSLSLSWKRGRNFLRVIGLRPDSQQSIGKVIEFWAEKTPEQVALRADDRQWTYAEFNAWANRIATVLADNGVKSGDSVGILMENRAEVLAYAAAAVKLGAIAGMLNNNQRGEVLDHSIKLLNAPVLIVGSECAEAFESSSFGPSKDHKTVYFWQCESKTKMPPNGFLDLDSEAANRPVTNPLTTPRVKAKQACFYIFTSGTTGLPKASVMTHYRWLSSMGGVGGLTLRLRETDTFYCCLPLYHNNALTVSWSAVLAAGATLAIDRKFSASRFWDRIRHYDATAFAYIGELLRYLLNQPASPQDKNHKVRLIVGNGLRPEIWAEFEERFGIERIYEFYGASESNIAFINAFGVRQTAGFTPMSFAIVEFDNDNETPIRDKKGRMKKVGKGGVGLLLAEVSDKRPFDGYTDPAAGEKKLLRNVFKKGDCWFNSGDLVRDQGLRHIQFVDRVGDTFRWKGENVATGEIEGVLATNDDIEHGAVYGVEIPGCDGRAGMAAISLMPGKSLDGAGLAQTLFDALPAYAVPLFLRIREQQDTTGTFKYRKVELKQNGFEPALVKEPLYVLLDAKKGYEPLTDTVYAGILSGQYRF